MKVPFFGGRATAALLLFCSPLALSGAAVKGEAENRMQQQTATTPALRYYAPPPPAARPETIEVDVCVYGGNASGVAAAVQAQRMGKKAVVLEPGGHLGGLTAGGLGNTDIGNKRAIGGIAREFYGRVGKKYGVNEEWRFEPRVAEQVFREMVREAGVPVHFQQFLRSVEKKGARLVSLTTESGLTVRAKVFIDATYEGDLMARAGVKYHVGRESNAAYDETLNGVQVRNTHQFDRPVDPYVVEGDPKSGLLPGINPGDPGKQGEGDRRVQAYNFRLCLTNDPANRIPFEKPAGYDPREYVLLSRYLKAGFPESEVFRKFDPIRNTGSGENPSRYVKVDKNNHGGLSTDFIGRNYDYPEADYATRERIFQEHVTYQKGLMWFLGNDPSVPERIRTRWSQWGLCRDEFPETGGWPHQLYVREARRMISDVVMTEHHCRGKQVAEDAVGLAAYTMDSHNCQRFVQDGRVRNEGDVQVGGAPPYPISYRSIVPREAECENLVVPVCLAASHIAYGSIRMEPVFMILGQSAATAAVLAMEGKTTVQDVSYEALKQRLLRDKQILAWVPDPKADKRPVDPNDPNAE